MHHMRVEELKGKLQKPVGLHIIVVEGLAVLQGPWPNWCEGTWCLVTGTQARKAATLPP